MSDGGAIMVHGDTRVHGEVTLLYWESCRPIAVCPWCGGDAKSHALGCWIPQREECRGSERELRAGLRKHELEALGYFVVLGKSREPDHYWLRCQRTECGLLFHLRKPPPMDVSGYFVPAWRNKPIEGAEAKAHRPEGLCVGDWASIWNHARIHGAWGGGW